MPLFRRKPKDVRDVIKGLKAASSRISSGRFHPPDPHIRATLITSAARIARLEKLNERASKLRKQIREIDNKWKDPTRTSDLEKRLKVINAQQMYEVEILGKYSLAAHITEEQMNTIKRIKGRATAGTIKDNERRESRKR